MVNEAQDMVCHFKGTNELLNKTEDLFFHKEKKTITFIENGFQLHVDGLPYYFQVSCFEGMGWNVFLTSLSGSIEDHEETDNYYHALEDAIDLINAKYFYEEIEGDNVSYNFFKLKSITIDKISHLQEVEEIKDTGRYVMKIIFKQSKEFPLEIGYSKIFKRWYYEFTNHETRESILENSFFRAYAEELDYMIGNFNHRM